MNHDLDTIFDDIMRGVEQRGWTAAYHPGVDILANAEHHLWARHNNPVGPWTYIPGKEPLGEGHRIPSLLRPADPPAT